MSPRLAVATLLLVALAAFAWQRVADSDTAAPPRSAPRPPSPPTSPADPRPHLRPADIRDVFRFADEGRARPTPDHGVLEAEGDASSPPPPSQPHLVGLVRRGGSLLAAMAADGDVVLVRPGDTVGELTVVAVAEDGVRVRRADGREEILPLD